MVIRKMLADHPRCKRLRTSLGKCTPNETHLCGNHTEFLKDQMEALRLTDPTRLCAVSTSQFDHTRTSSSSRGRGNRGKSSYRGKPTSKTSKPWWKPAYKPGFSSTKDQEASSKPRGIFHRVPPVAEGRAMLLTPPRPAPRNSSDNSGDYSRDNFRFNSSG